MNLIGDDDDDEEVFGNSSDGAHLKINKAFASKYERQKRSLELAKARDLLEAGGEGDEDSSESETEDEDAELLSPNLDLQIINTINMIKRKDPKIYDASTKWFEEPSSSPDSHDDDDEDDEDRKGRDKEKKTKKTFKDVAREQLLQNAEESDEDTNHQRVTMRKPQLLYDAEQRSLRNAFLTAAQGDDAENAGEEEGSDEDGILQVKQKSAKEHQEEEEAMQRALAEMKELEMQDGNGRSEEIAFLTSYMSKKMWRQPAHLTVDVEERQALEEDDEEEDDKADLFESKYNFRFEQLQEQQEQQLQRQSADAGNLRSRVSFDLLASSTQVQGHARNTADSLRRTDDKRKQEREARKERKEKEKRQKEAELRRLKNLKRQELHERLRRIEDLGGLHNLEIDEGALDEDWDPDKHEQMMQRQFGDSYYEQEDDLHLDDELGDPLATELAGEEGDPNEYDQDGYDQDGYDQDGYDQDGQAEYEEGDVDLEDEKRRVKGLVEDLYRLDYEDIVAGIPCRFKYRQVEPEGFGLTAEEILLADDSELNRYVSLKKIAPYETRRRWDDAELSRKRKKLRSTLKERQAELQRVLGQEHEQDEERKAKKSRQQQQQQQLSGGAERGGEGEGEPEKKRRRRRRNRPADDEPSDIVDGMESVAEGAASPREESVAMQASVGEDSGKKSASKEKEKKKKKKKTGDGKDKKAHKRQAAEDSKDPVQRRLALYK